MIRSSLALLMAVLPCAIFAATCNYEQFGKDHTMCAYQAKPCVATDTACKRSFSANEKNTILKKHNDLRVKVATGGQTGQPKASNMREMKWNDELATVAQRWADQTKISHDQNRLIAGYWWVGQNIAYSGSTAPGSTLNFSWAIQGWYDEVSDFNSANINPFQSSTGKVTGHYTQVVWADTDRVGCGYSYYKEGGWYNNLYVCNYAIGGNVIGQPMYNKGEPTTSCSNGKSTAYPSLCAS